MVFVELLSIVLSIPRRFGLDFALDVLGLLCPPLKKFIGWMGMPMFVHVLLEVDFLDLVVASVLRAHAGDLSYSCFSVAHIPPSLLPFPALIVPLGMFLAAALCH